MGPTTGPRVPTSIADFRATASTRLGGFPHTEVPDAPDLRRAAVLLCVVDEPDGPLSVIVIKRAYRGRNAGQWGLPGGRVDAGETTEQAAIRELHEELGLTATPADILGRLDDFPATSGFVITPIVAALDDAGELRPNPAEVHSVHLVDLDRLAADDVAHWVSPKDVALRADAPSTTLEGAGVLQMRLGENMTIHAPTGAMLWQFREVVLLGRDATEARIAHFAQPEWTRH
ncbi:NUDIX hydrolase [Nocardia sp. NPDC004278]